MKTKFNFQGEIGGKCEFNYCLVNGRYYEKGTNEPFFNLITNQEPKIIEENEIPKLSPEEAFVINEIPF